MEWNIILGAICAVLAVLLSYVTLSRNKSKDDKSDGQQTGIVLTELGYIKGSIDGMNAKLDKQDERFIEIAQRLSAVEASAKQAHKRLDRMEANVS